MRHTAIFNQNMKERIYPNRRVGRPKATWTETTLAELWEGVRNTNLEWRHTTLDTTNIRIRNKIDETARRILEK